MAHLRAGGVVAYPTETFYGIGCLALDHNAIERLLAIKPRAKEASPYPLIIGDMAQLSMVISQISDHAEALMDRFWPGPLTLVMQGHSHLAPCLRGEDGGVAVRLTSHPLAQSLARSSGQALISTSANPSGQPPPLTAAEVAAYFVGQDVLILDGGICVGGSPSTILDLQHTPHTILRQGAISEADIIQYLPSEYADFGLQLLDYSSDSMFHGRVRLYQHRRGYRFSIDAVLLSYFAASLTSADTLDLCTGCGVIPLLMADLWQRRGDAPKFTAIECQSALARLARFNVTSNNRVEQIEIIESDLRQWQPRSPRKWPIITCNPPYRPAGEGSISPQQERAAARHELHGSLRELIAAAGNWLQAKGKLLLVYPAASLMRILLALTECQLELSRLQMVHARADTAANLVLIEASKSSKCPLQILAPLVLYNSEQANDYTPTVQSILNGEISL